LITSLFVASAVFADGYNRSDFDYRSYKPSSQKGYYTGQYCDFVNIDHVVSLKDAYDSGASSWSDSLKEAFANDRSNHVPSCGHINSSKGSAGPSVFFQRSNDGKGLDYEIVTFCEYVAIYHSVKQNYELSFDKNSKATFQSCGVAL
jgi:hypothetical protein